MDYARRCQLIANGYYNQGLEKARIRDLSGAAECLKKSLHFNKYQTDARNLLGLIYYEMGETAESLVQWVISQNLQPEHNRAEVYLRRIQGKPGRLEAESAFRAGADLVTVLAVTDLATVRACVEAADRAGRRVVADMICVSDLSGRARELEEAGIYGIAVHTGVDQQAQGRTPLQDLAVLRRAVQRAELSAAGGISLASLPDCCALGPDVIVIGGGILSAPDPVAQARAIRRAMPGPDGGILAEPRA